MSERETNRRLSEANGDSKLETVQEDHRSTFLTLKPYDFIWPSISNVQPDLASC